MRYIDFAEVFAERPIFTARDAALRFPDFHDRQLYYWQQNGLIQLLRRPFYRLASRPWTMRERWAVANQIYAPSYISLESALSYYGFIPEGVFHVTSVTTRNTQRFDVDDTRFFYRNVKPDWFFGYTILEHEDAPVRMAEPEKALLDLLHLNPSYEGPDDFEALRFDRPGILNTLREDRWHDYLSLSTNKALGIRARAFQEWLHDHTG